MGKCHGLWAMVVATELTMLEGGGPMETRACSGPQVSTHLRVAQASGTSERGAREGGEWRHWRTLAVEERRSKAVASEAPCWARGRERMIEETEPKSARDRGLGHQAVQRVWEGWPPMLWRKDRGRCAPCQWPAWYTAVTSKEGGVGPVGRGSQARGEKRARGGSGRYLWAAGEIRGLEAGLRDHRT